MPAKPNHKLKQPAGFALPATVSRAPLLENGSDDRFRQLVYDLLTVSCAWKRCASIWRTGWA